MKESIALIPYWLADNPHTIEISDHYWWLKHLEGFDKVLYCGPYIDDNISRTNYQTRYSLKTASLTYELQEIYIRKIRGLGIELGQITLYWHVIEAAATCRVIGLHLLSCPKICVIGDTHHMHRPISSLYEYLSSEPFTHVSCSHNQYNPFFSAILGLKTVDFPFMLPNMFYARNISYRIGGFTSLNYYGSVLSIHHIHRSVIINRLLIDPKVSVRVNLHGRFGFNRWASLVMQPHLNLTCSLNGTFSFQTFLPMLGGAVIYTDPISKANWVGSVLKDGTNCEIYTSVEDIRSKLLNIDGRESEMTRIGTTARNDICSFLKTEDEIISMWRHGLPSQRTLITERELRLHRWLIECILKNGKPLVVSLIKLFEDVQELHRIHWLLEAKISCNVCEETRAKNSIAIARCICGMISLLPRVKTKILTNTTSTQDVRVTILNSGQRLLEAILVRDEKSEILINSLTNKQWIKTYPKRESY
jgi:hypothetical protein